MARIISENTPSEVVEAYRALYTNLMYIPIGSECKKLVISSASHGEGKTVTAINLAYTVASTSKEARVLFIDANMRDREASKLLSLVEGVEGLSDFLSGDAKAPTLSSSVYPNLDILPVGSPVSNVTAMLSSGRMADLFGYCNSNYDYVIIDTPSVNGYSDPVFFSNHADGYILVCKADKSDLHQVHDAVEALGKVDARVLGFILTDATLPKVANK